MILGKKKVKEVIEFLDYEELLKLKRDLDNGGTHLLKLVDSQIKKIELSHEVFCSDCGAKLDKNRASNYTLVFGPHDFMKKASFCGIDCMEHFISKLKNMKNGSSDRTDDSSEE